MKTLLKLAKGLQVLGVIIYVVSIAGLLSIALTGCGTAGSPDDTTVIRETAPCSKDDTNGDGTVDQQDCVKVVTVEKPVVVEPAPSLDDRMVALSSSDDKSSYIEIVKRSDGSLYVLPDNKLVGTNDDSSKAYLPSIYGTLTAVVAGSTYLLKSSAYFRKEHNVLDDDGDKIKGTRSVELIIDYAGQEAVDSGTKYNYVVSYIISYRDAVIAQYVIKTSATVSKGGQ